MTDHPETAPAAESKRLAFFERYLTVWVLVCMVVGVAFGKLLPDVTAALSKLELISVLARSAHERDSLRAELADAGIETRPTFYPIHTMPMYATDLQRHIVAEDIGQRGIVLPSWPGLPTAAVDEICSVISRFYSKNV